MFISDTINVINHALEWSPYALMDKLADHLSGQQEDLSKVKNYLFFILIAKVVLLFTLTFMIYYSASFG